MQPLSKKFFLCSQSPQGYKNPEQEILPRDSHLIQFLFPQHCRSEITEESILLQPQEDHDEPVDPHELALADGILEAEGDQQYAEYFCQTRHDIQFRSLILPQPTL